MKNNTTLPKENIAEAFAPAAEGGTLSPSYEAPMSIQCRLEVGDVNDPYEAEADAVADKVVANTGQAFLQRKCAHCEEEQIQRKPFSQSIQKKGDAGPTIVSEPFEQRINANKGTGLHMDGSTRNFMETSFDAGFNDVKIHTDQESIQMNRELGSKAFTIGNDIYFNENRYQPGSSEGRHLLAHELTHTIQQQGANAVQTKLIQRSGDDDAIEVDLVTVSNAEALKLHNQGIDLPVVGPAQPVKTQNVLKGNAWSQNKRKTTKRAPGFTGDTDGTYIKNLDVTIHASSKSIVTVTWVNMGKSPGYNLPGTLSTSPGAGNCTYDCSDITQSQTNGSHCTPLSPPTYTVQGFSTALGSYPSATFVTWYHYDRGVAFHYYDVPDYPASHGCTRLSHAEEGAEWIYDNSLPGITTVVVSRQASEGPGPKCWKGGALKDRGK